MAKKIEVARKYRFKDSELLLLAEKILSNFKRDSREFEVYNYNKQDVNDQFEKLMRDFADIKSDDFMKAKVGIATETKDNAANDITKFMTSIRVRARVLWGEKSTKYKMFPSTQVPHKELVRLASKYIHVMNEYYAELSERGITQDMINQLNDYKNALDKALDEQARIMSERDMLTEERKQKGNKLYDFVSEISKIGKDIWNSTNETKYNDYVIYNTSSEKENVAKEEKITRKE